MNDNQFVLRTYLIAIGLCIGASIAGIYTCSNQNYNRANEQQITTKESKLIQLTTQPTTQSSQIELEERR